MTYPNPSDSISHPDGTPALPGDIFAVTSGNGTGASTLPTRTRPVIDEILKNRVKTSNPWVDFATGFISELFSGFGTLFELADSIVSVLTGGIIGGPIGGQSWVAKLSDWVGSFTGGLGELQNFVKGIIDTIMNALGFFGSGFGLGALLDAIFNNKQSTDATKTDLAGLTGNLLTNPAAVLGAIPQTLVSGLTGALNGVQGFAQNIIDTIMNAFGNVGSGFSLSHLLTQLGAIPQSVVSGLGGALGALLPKADWTSFLTQAVNSAGSGSSGSTGVPLLDNALNAFASLFGKAQTAQTTAQTVQQTVQSQAITTSVLGDLTIVKTTFPTSGTWNRSAIPSGCTTRVYTEVQAINGGAGGGKPALPTVVTYQYNNGTSTTTSTYVVPGAVGRGGLDGGFASKVFDPSVLGTSQSVVVGLGGAGATTNGANGADGGQSSFGGTLLQCVSGVSAIPSSRGPLATTARPGKGGDGGLFYNATIRTDTGNNSNTYGALAGSRGEPSAGAASPTGNGANGTAAVTDPTQLYGGSGANGGNAAAGTGTQTGTAGGVGGLPGGGGGGGGQAGSNATRNNGNGGNGGNGYVIVLEAFK